jgi:uncharacterized membrane protein
MLPDPLHPAIVHLPLGLAVVAPAVALFVALAIRRSRLPLRAWTGIVLLQALMMGAVWVAAATGEREEERVEAVVAERHIEAHEERAEGLMVVTALSLLVAGIGLAPGTAGSLGRGATVVATLGVLAAGVLVGHSGGELVYRHGAASAYVEGAGAPGGERFAHEEHDDDD